MFYAILENDIVVNVIVASEKFIEEAKLNAVLSSTAKVGDQYINGEFITPIKEDENA